MLMMTIKIITQEEVLRLDALQLTLSDCFQYIVVTCLSLSVCLSVCLSSVFLSLSALVPFLSCYFIIQFFNDNYPKIQIFFFLFFFFFSKEKMRERKEKE